jgi:hypothetical protein
MGLSLRNVVFKAEEGRQGGFRRTGEVSSLISDLSGPLALSASSYLEGGYFQIFDFDRFKAGAWAFAAGCEVLRDFEQRKNSLLINSLDRLLPKRIIPRV